ncbi:MAG: hypothetical protein WC969_01240 [Elusimicrobiota bacterium]|jgi:hypothetical protein
MTNDRRRVILAAALLSFCGVAARAEGLVDFDQGVVLEAPRLLLQGERLAAAEPPAPVQGAGAFVERGRVARVWPEIVFARGADYAEFAYTMSQNRDVVRKMMLQEFGELLIPMAGANADVNELAKTILQAILIFDGMHAVHKEQALQGLEVSFEHTLRAELDRLFTAHRLSDGRRRVEFLSRGSAVFAAVKSRSTDEQSARSALENVDILLYGSYTLLGGDQIQATLTVEKLAGGQSRSFVAAGAVGEVMADLARQLFDFFQANEYRDWFDPQPGLEWIPAAPGQPRTTAAAAKLYCGGQGARLPYARELILASQGGQYRPGGIPPLEADGVYLVADKQRYDEQHYFFTGDSGDATGGPIRTSAGYGVLHASYWCVRGKVSKEVSFYENLYRIRRKAGDGETVRAVECLLEKLEDFGAHPWECGGAFSSAEKAAQALAAKGHRIRLP